MKHLLLLLLLFSEYSLADALSEDDERRLQETVDLFKSDSDEEAVTRTTRSIYQQVSSATRWELMSEHWPKAVDGNADSLLIVYEVMGSCRPYRKRFDGKDIAEVHAEYAANNDPELNHLNESIWKDCGPIYENWNQYVGWKDMLEASARAGQPYAMVVTASSQLRNPETIENGLALIESALLTADIAAVAQMTTVYFRAGIDVDIASGWLVAACELGLDCSADGAYMNGTCGMFSETCGVHESVQDYLIRELGDNGYLTAKRRSRTIVDAIVGGQIDALQIRSDFK